MRFVSDSSSSLQTHVPCPLSPPLPAPPQPATAGGQPKLPGSGSRRLLLQADGTNWWLEADGAAPADVTGVYFFGAPQWLPASHQTAVRT